MVKWYKGEGNRTLRKGLASSAKHETKIRGKDEEIARLNAAIKNLKNDHKIRMSECHDMMNEYRRKSEAKIEDLESALEKQKLSSKKDYNSTKRDKELADLQKKDEQLQAENSRMKETLTKQNTEVIKATNKRGLTLAKVDGLEDKVKKPKRRTQENSSGESTCTNEDFSQALERFKEQQRETEYYLSEVKVGALLNQGISSLKFDKKVAFDSFRRVASRVSEQIIKMQVQPDGVQQVWMPIVIQDRELSLYWLQRGYWYYGEYGNVVSLGGRVLNTHRTLEENHGGCACGFINVVESLMVEAKNQR